MSCSRRNVFNSSREYREELEDFMYSIIDRVSHASCNGSLNSVAYDATRPLNLQNQQVIVQPQNYSFPLANGGKENSVNVSRSVWPSHHPAFKGLRFYNADDH